MIRSGGHLVETRAVSGLLPFGDATPPPPGWGTAGPGFGPPVSEATALSIGATYACVRIITDTVATAPLYAYRGYDDQKTRQKQPPLLVQPYCDISRMDWLVQMVASLALRGNAFGLIIQRDDRKFPMQIMPIHPDRASVKRNTDGDVEYRFNGQLISTDDVFHVRYISVPGSLVGINPIDNLRVPFAAARGADQTAAAFYTNAAQPGGIIRVPGDLDEEETLGMMTAWNQRHQGAGMSSMPAILTGGAEWQQITLTADQSQFLATRSFSIYEIAMCFGVPPHWLGQQDRSPTATGIEDQVRMFNTITAAGYLKRLEEALSTPAISPRGQYVEFDLDERLKGDLLTRMQAYTLARNASIWTSDEIRGKEGDKALPGGIGSNVLLPMNMAAIGADGKPIVPMAQPGAQPPKPVQTGGEPQPPTAMDKPAKSNPSNGKKKNK